MTLRSRYLLLASVLTLVAAPAFAVDNTTGKGGPTPEAVVDLGTSPIAKMSSRYSVDNFTCNTTWNTLLQKKITTSAKGDVSIMFQSENFPGCRMLLRALRNGTVLPGPGDAGAPFAPHDTNGELSTNGFNFLDNDRPAGVYTYAVQCQCDAGTALVDERSLTIFHR